MTEVCSPIFLLLSLCLYAIYLIKKKKKKIVATNLLTLAIPTEFYWFKYLEYIV